jgi:hypothetical protein
VLRAQHEVEQRAQQRRRDALVYQRAPVLVANLQPR